MGGNISKCSNSGTIQGGTMMGGIVGGNTSISETNYISINECTNTGAITSSSCQSMKIRQDGKDADYVACLTGGIVGYASKTNITDSNNNRTINTTSSDASTCSIGGIAGEIRDGTITQCYNGKNGNLGTTNKYHNVGGIVGIGLWNVQISNCYNLGSISGNTCLGGIIGQGLAANIRYCYNAGAVSGFGNVGGIVCHIKPFASKSYENNYMYYCYNRGTVTASSGVGGLGANISYADIDYTYALTGTNSKLWNSTSNCKNATHQGFQDKATLTSTVLNFGSNFKSDYTGSASVNDGFPILSWQ